MQQLYRKHEKGVNKAKWAHFIKDLHLGFTVSLYSPAYHTPTALRQNTPSFDVYKGFELGGLPMRWERLERSPTDYESWFSLR